MLHTSVLDPNHSDIARAATLLSAGELVAFPTETVYGLGADACNDMAVAKIFDAKSRPRFNPLIAHVADLEKAQEIARFDEIALRLARAFWPGPLTMVLPLLPEAKISPLVTAGLETVAIRSPAHPIAQDLLRAFGGPLAAPSANPSGRISPTRAAHVVEGLGGKIAGIIDGGTCDIGVESTILDCANAPTLLRPGGVPVEAIEQHLGYEVSTRSDAAPLTAPGQLRSHYAPQAAVRLEATEVRSGEILMGFGPEAKGAALNLSPTGDLIEAAANLFHFLRELDNGEGSIAVSPIPETGLGCAINDRLRRAAAPRD